MSVIKGAIEPYWLHEPSVNLGTPGTSRVEPDADPQFKTRPVGFTAKLDEPEGPVKRGELWVAKDMRGVLAEKWEDE